MKQLILNNHIIQEVPEGAKNFTVIESHSYFPSPRVEHSIGGENLPHGNYKIVQPSEEVAREIVERMDNNNWPKPVYKNYCPMLDINFFTALESYASLLKANQISNAVILKQI